MLYFPHFRAAWNKLVSFLMKVWNECGQLLLSMIFFLSGWMKRTSVWLWLTWNFRKESPTSSSTLKKYQIWNPLDCLKFLSPLTSQVLCKSIWLLYPIQNMRVILCKSIFEITYYYFNIILFVSLWTGVKFLPFCFQLFNQRLLNDDTLLVPDVRNTQLKMFCPVFQTSYI